MAQKLILFFIISLGTKAFCQNLRWNALKPGKTYSMTLDIVLNDEYALNGEFALRKGDPLNYESIVRTDNYIALSFKNPMCQDQSKSSLGMVFINPDSEHQDEAHHLGISFYVGCYNTIYMNPTSEADLSFLSESVK